MPFITRKKWTWSKPYIAVQGHSSPHLQTADTCRGTCFRHQKSFFSKSKNAASIRSGNYLNRISCLQAHSNLISSQQICTKGWRRYWLWLLLLCCCCCRSKLILTASKILRLEQMHVSGYQICTYISQYIIMQRVVTFTYRTTYRLHAKCMVCRTIIHIFYLKIQAEIGRKRL